MFVTALCRCIDFVDYDIDFNENVIVTYCAPFQCRVIGYTMIIY